MSQQTTGSIRSFYNCETGKDRTRTGFSIFQDKYQLIWLISHVITILGFMIYSIGIFNPEKHYLSIFPSYKLTNYSCILTYIIVIYKRYFCDEIIEQKVIDNKTLISYILKTENVQIIIFAFLWIVTKASVFKLIPFVIYSLLNVSCFLVFEAFPETQFSISLAPFVNYIKNPLLIFSAFIDIFVIGLLFYEAFQSNSYYALFLYVFIWCLRMDNSEASRIAIFNIIQVIDKLFKNNLIPTKIKQTWICFKIKVLRLLSFSTKD